MKLNRIVRIVLFGSALTGTFPAFAAGEIPQYIQDRYERCVSKATTASQKNECAQMRDNQARDR